MITHFDHVQLAMPVGEEAKARAFFVGVLAMTEETKPSPLDVRGGCWFRAGQAILHLGVESPFSPQKKAHPAFVVDNLDALAQALAAAGCVITWDDALPNRRRFYVADPFGNRLEFIRDGDGFGQK